MFVTKTLLSIVICISTILFNSLYGVEIEKNIESKNVLKILILDFKNKTNNTNYDYLGSTLTSSVDSYMQKKIVYNNVSVDLATNSIKEIQADLKQKKEKHSLKEVFPILSKKYDIDIIIFGDYKNVDSKNLELENVEGNNVESTDTESNNIKNTKIQKYDELIKDSESILVSTSLYIGFNEKTYHLDKVKSQINGRLFDTANSMAKKMIQNIKFIFLANKDANKEFFPVVLIEDLKTNIKTNEIIKKESNLLKDFLQDKVKIKTMNFDDFKIYTTIKKINIENLDIYSEESIKKFVTYFPYISFIKVSDQYQQTNFKVIQDGVSTLSISIEKLYKRSTQHQQVLKVLTNNMRIEPTSISTTKKWDDVFYELQVLGGYSLQNINKQIVNGTYVGLNNRFSLNKITKPSSKLYKYFLPMSLALQVDFILTETANNSMQDDRVGSISTKYSYNLGLIKLQYGYSFFWNHWRLLLDINYFGYYFGKISGSYSLNNNNSPVSFWTYRPLFGASINASYIFKSAIFNFGVHYTYYVDKILWQSLNIDLGVGYVY